MRRTGFALGVLGMLLWLTLPSIVLADDCRNLGADERDGTRCPVAGQVMGLLTGLAMLAAAALTRRAKQEASDFLRGVAKDAAERSDPGTQLLAAMGHELLEHGVPPEKPPAPPP